METPTPENSAAVPTTGADLIDQPAASSSATPPPAASAPAPAAELPADHPGRAFIGQKDARGVEFHPAKFRLKGDVPQTDSIGRFVPLSSGRKSSSDTPAGTPSPSGSRLPSDDPAPPPDSASLAVETGIGIIQTAFVLLGDEEGQLSDTEKVLLRRPLKRVLEKYNIGDEMLPCELDLAVAVASLLILRLSKPKTATKWEKIKAWCADKWFARKGRQTASAVASATAGANA